MPAYKLNLGLQNSSSSIADVISGVFRLKFLWEHMDTTDSEQEFIYFLIHFLLKKFKYELESPVYQVRNTFLITLNKSLVKFVI